MLTDIGTRIQRGLDALLAGLDVADELRARLKAEKSRQADVAAQLEALSGRRPDILNLGESRLREELRARVRDVRGLLGRDIPRTRQILRKLLVTPLTCAPFEENGRRGYRFTGQGSYADVLPARLSTLVVTPAGFEPAFTVRHALS